MNSTMIDEQQYLQQGYLTGLPVYSQEQVGELMNLYQRLRHLLPDGEPTEAMDWWHQLDKQLWEVASNPVVLDYVEGILGPDFYLWGSQFFSKDPHNPKTVPWHQDGFYWPLAPHKTVTVWLAFADSDQENAAMRVIPGTHDRQFKHNTSHDNSAVLDMSADLGSISDDDAVYLELKAGQCSLHDDNVLHGSGPNTSDRLRCGLTLRYSAGEVKCDTSVWPFFKAYWVRGQDKWNHNPVGEPPTQNMKEFETVTPRTGQR